LKITRVETVIVNAVHRNWIFVKVLTDQPGLHGWGEATLEWKTRAVKGAIDDLAPFVTGQDPMRIEHLVNRMTRFSFWPLSSIGLTAVSGIEQALWDIKGKALGVPVWQLLGGKVREKVRVYTHLGRGSVGFQVPNSDIGAYCDAVQKTVEMGYDAVKLGFVPVNGYDAPIKAVRHTEKLARAVRERVGDNVDIMVDFHGRPDSLVAAIAYVNAIAPIKPLFCEEVIQPGDAPAMADIARRVDRPLATGERLFTPREFANIADRPYHELVAPSDHIHTPANESRSVVRAQEPR
jgi:galactonate dehydratase